MSESRLKDDLADVLERSGNGSHGTDIERLQATVDRLEEKVGSLSQQMTAFLDRQAIERCQARIASVLREEGCSIEATPTINRRTES